MSVLVVAVASVTACSFLTDLDRLSGGDASTTSDAAGTGETGADATTAPDGSSDAVAPTDAGGDAKDAGILDRSVACAAQPISFLFCADFDSVAQPQDGWSYIDINPDSGTWGLDTVNFRTGPAAGVVSIPGGGSGSEHAQLGYSNPGPLSAVSVAFDLRLDVSTLGTLATNAMGQVFIGNNHSATLLVGPGATASLDCYNGGVESESPVAAIDVPPTRTWFRARITLDSTKANLFFDGKLVATVAMQAATGSVDAIVGGVYTSGPGSTMRAQFDNVLVSSP